MNAIITDGRVLAGMARQGFIDWQPGYVDRHWTGATVKRVHVQPGPKLDTWWQTFTYRGKEYRLQYVDGCFHPFVTRIGERLPSFV
jgi:hypothetical protein